MEIVLNPIDFRLRVTHLMRGGKRITIETGETAPDFEPRLLAAVAALLRPTGDPRPADLPAPTATETGGTR